MQDVVATPSQEPRGKSARFSSLKTRLRAESPSLADSAIAFLSAALLVISFPDFNVWLLAWVGVVPLLLLVAHQPVTWRSFCLGWLFGSVFFYGSCYWLTYSMIHTGGIPPWLAFPLLAPGAVLLGLFPAVCLVILAHFIRKWGRPALFLAPVIWVALEWARLEVTGQLWNAIGYSQAYEPVLIQSARWGGVYAVSGLIMLVNAAIAFFLCRPSKRSVLFSGAAISLVGTLLVVGPIRSAPLISSKDGEAVVIAVQPNVPMTIVKSEDELRELTTRHFEMSETALRELPDDGKPRLVIWPESPMNFEYGTNNSLQESLANFAKANRTSVLLNSQEAAPKDGLYNSALLINEAGSLVTQYDKIRLLPFGEYVPLPRWVPGAGLIRGIVGDFTPGTSYSLMPVGKVRAGVFICIESAYPAIARTFTSEGADVLINISNDGYLGPTAVMRQHLANAVFRAVENGRPLLRVTNTGITAFVTPTGQVQDETQGFKPEIRTWRIAQASQSPTFYTRHGDVFAVGCAMFSVLMFVLSLRRVGLRASAG